MNVIVKVDGPQPDWLMVEMQGSFTPKLNEEDFVDEMGHLKMGVVRREGEVCCNIKDF